MARSAFAHAYGRRIDTHAVELKLSLKSSSSHADFKLEQRLHESGATRADETSRQQWLARAARAAHASMLQENPVFMHREHFATGTDEKGRGKRGGRLLATVVPQNASLDARLELAVEARLLTLLERHANVLKLVAFVTEGGPTMLVTEYPQGGRLRSYLRAYGSALAAADITPGCLGLASAMAYLESLAIVHRGLSLDSVAVGRDLGDVKLMEFGGCGWNRGRLGVARARGRC